jgi:DNA-binding IclR family transcriptional regulator
VSILHAVAQEPATLAELVARTGLPRATAHRLAVALEGHRLVRRTDGGSWAPGPALAELGRATADIGEIAGRHLANLRDATGESAQFYVRDGATRVCVAAAEPAVMGSRAPTGTVSRSPLVRSAAATQTRVEPSRT